MPTTGVEPAPRRLFTGQDRQQQTGEFTARKGPVFANVVLADEINRASAKVQSALLEAVEECQVTLGTETCPLDEPFFVLATQNPIEQEGTYPLPEAQLDRFLLKLQVPKTLDRMAARRTGSAAGDDLGRRTPGGAARGSARRWEPRPSRQRCGTPPKSCRVVSAPGARSCWSPTARAAPSIHRWCLCVPRAGVAIGAVPVGSAASATPPRGGRDAAKLRLHSRLHRTEFCRICRWRANPTDS